MLRELAVIAAALPLLAPALLAPAPLAPGLPASKGAAVAQPVSDPPVEQVSVYMLTQSGSPCPAGTAFAAIAAGNAQLTLSHAAFGAVMDPTMPATALRRGCEVLLDVQVPAGYSYAISGVHYAAWVLLPEGATARVRTNFSFQGRRPDPIPYTVTGPVDDIWRHDGPVEPLVWSPCDERRYLIINTELRIFPGTSDPAVDVGALSADSAYSAPWTYDLTWRRC